MKKVRIIYKIDGSIAIVHPVQKSRRKKESESEWLNRVFDKAMQGPLGGLQYDDVDISVLPKDRRNRDKWRGEKGKGIRVQK